jgi:hypothetical protein
LLFSTFITGCYNPIIYGLMNSRFKACFIAVLYRIPGFQKFFSRRLRGTQRDRFPTNNGESIFLALNHPSCITTKTNRIVKHDDYFNGDIRANGTMTFKHIFMKWAYSEIRISIIIIIKSFVMFSFNFFCIFSWFYFTLQCTRCCYLIFTV